MKFFFTILMPIIWSLISLVLYGCGNNPFAAGAIIGLLVGHFIGDPAHPVDWAFIAGFAVMAIAGLVLDFLKLRPKTLGVIAGVSALCALVAGLLLSTRYYGFRGLPDNPVEVAGAAGIAVNWGLMLTVPVSLVYKFVIRYHKKAVEKTDTNL